MGYPRVSTKSQLLDRQIAALEAAGCARIFADKKSTKNAEREELWAALDYLRPGDTLVVPALDRLGTDHPVPPWLEERTAPPALCLLPSSQPGSPKPGAWVRLQTDLAQSRNDARLTAAS
ncbi:recombinase family protein [Streptomyces sioyaensis]|uniref:recombinase family protein n=1 Tax=Streptomyces sioyaensis TaxID=67364 RepID=UPI0037B7FF1C